jgi:hypothetical protein
MAFQLHDAREKLRYYRKCADGAGHSANAATDPDMESAFLAVQRTWTYLAEKLEREMALAGEELIIADDDIFIPADRESRPNRHR